jgi:hypothetical protein
LSKKVVKYDNDKKYLGNIAVSEIVRDSSLIRFHYKVDTIAIEPVGETFNGTSFAGYEVMDTHAGTLNDSSSFLLASCPSDETKCGIYLVTGINTCVKQSISFAVGDLIVVGKNFYKETVWNYSSTDKFVPLFMPKDYNSSIFSTSAINVAYTYYSELELKFSGSISNEIVEYDLVFAMATIPQVPFANQFLTYKFDIEGIGTNVAMVNAFRSGGYQLEVMSDTADTVDNYDLTTERGFDPPFLYPRLNFVKLQIFIKQLEPDGSGDPMKIKLKMKCGGSGAGAVGSNVMLFGAVNKKKLNNNNFNSINY